jgi:hypothetical protein
MMNSLKVAVFVVLGLFTLQGIAEAASVSTRVRILESKVNKQNKLIKQQTRATQQQNVKLDKGLKDVEDLKAQVEKFMRDAEKKNKSKEDKRYAYP